MKRFCISCVLCILAFALFCGGMQTSVNFAYAEKDIDIKSKSAILMEIGRAHV